MQNPPPTRWVAGTRALDVHVILAIFNAVTMLGHVPPMRYIVTALKL
jgi:hypothetical protein